MFSHLSQTKRTPRSLILTIRRTYTLSTLHSFTLRTWCTYSFHSGHFYSASSSPLLFRVAPDTARILYGRFTPNRTGSYIVSKRLAQSAYVASRAGVEPIIIIRPI